MDEASSKHDFHIPVLHRRQDFVVAREVVRLTVCIQTRLISVALHPEIGASILGGPMDAIPANTSLSFPDQLDELRRLLLVLVFTAFLDVDAGDQGEWEIGRRRMSHGATAADHQRDDKLCDSEASSHGWMGIGVLPNGQAMAQGGHRSDIHATRVQYLLELGARCPVFLPALVFLSATALRSVERWGWWEP